MILLDTDICIEILRRNERVIDRRAQYDDSTAVAFMSVAELYYGAEKSSKPAKNHGLIDMFLLTIEVVHTDLDILREFGRIKRLLFNENAMLPDADILIAATALVRADKLITGNTRHFRRFQNLAIENWM